MAWIRDMDEDEARAEGGRLARLYKAGADEHTGRVDNILRVHALRPDSLDGHLRLYRAAMHSPQGLTRREREAMAVAVSAVNHCGY
ncbi:MAG: carboxymuconolactone decarboxylase family protein [Deltaproteobacteria bacterium]|nr:carboxymuconolactone decarboxylase family protein [Deltaproteobacteria bacterium]